MSRVLTAVLVGALGLGLASWTADAQNVKKEKQTDARIKKCQSLSGAERDACLRQVREQPEPNGATGQNQGEPSDNTASPQQVQPGQPGAQSGAKKTDPSSSDTGQGQRRQQ